MRKMTRFWVITCLPALLKLRPYGAIEIRLLLLLLLPYIRVCVNKLEPCIHDVQFKFSCIFTYLVKFCWHAQKSSLSDSGYNFDNATGFSLSDFLQDRYSTNRGRLMMLFFYRFLFHVCLTRGPWKYVTLHITCTTNTPTKFQAENNGWRLCS